MNLKEVKNKLLKNQRNINKDEKIMITSLTQYKSLLKRGYTNFDFSQLDITFEDIQDINLENMGLDIDLDKIFVPFHGGVLYHNNVLRPLLRNFGDDFIDLTNSNLKGNNVVGDLKNRYEYVQNVLKDVCTFLYNEDTFDSNYKELHPEFFLDPNAPEKLKYKFYRPAVKTVRISRYSEAFEYEEQLCFYRQALTFEEYKKYYEFLNGKYIERFNISVNDYIKINEYQQLVNSCEYVENLNNESKELIKKKVKK